VKHLAWTECRWFRGTFAGEDVDDPVVRGDATFEFTIEPSDTVESVLAFYDEQCKRSRAITTRASLDDRAVGRRVPDEISLRWILVYMLEETARHAGHADIIRETLHGTTGD